MKTNTVCVLRKVRALGRSAFTLREQGALHCEKRQLLIIPRLVTRNNVLHSFSVKMEFDGH